MAVEEWKKTNLVFGSAGMAASGMMPRTEPAPKPKPREPEPVEEPKAEETPQDGAESVDETGVEAEVPVVQEGTDFDEVEVVPQFGYGINSKAQGLFTDLKAAVLADGSRVVDGTNWDLVFANLEGIVTSGVSDPDEEWRADLANSYNFDGGYADYRELLARAKPDLAVIPQCGTGNRYEIIKNSLMSGCHVICPAPFSRNLEDADELIALADRRGLKLSVAFPFQLDPNVDRFFDMIDGLIGELVEIRIYGQMGETSGGEDLLLRGGQLFNLARKFSGDPVWCHATILKDGERCSREDVVDHDLLGYLVGDSINAQVFMDSGVMVSFVSHPKMQNWSGDWGMEFIGSHNVMRLFGGPQPVLSIMENPGERSAEYEERWEYWPEHRNPYHPTVDSLEGAEAGKRLVVADWLEAIKQDRVPVCSAKNAMKNLEMIHGILHSGLTGKRVYFPLVNRHHPLLPEIVPHEMDFRRSA